MIALTRRKHIEINDVNLAVLNTEKEADVLSIKNLKQVTVTFSFNSEMEAEAFFSCFIAAGE